MLTKKNSIIRDIESFLPNDWEIGVLGELTDVRDGTHDSPKFFNQGIPFITSKNLKESGLDFSDIKYISSEDHNKFQKRSKVDEGDILFGMIGTIGNPVIVYKEDLEFSIKNVALIKFTDERLFNSYVKYLLESNFIHRTFNRISDGGVQKFISLGTIRKLPIPVPPVDEQKKITSILSSVDEAIEQTEQIIEQTTKVKKGLMQQLLIKGIGHTKFKETSVGEIPKSWEIKNLSDVANKSDKYSFTGGPFGSDLTSKEYTGSGVRIVQLQNIGDGYFYDDYKIYTSVEKAEQLYKCNIFSGDIIIAKMAEPVARACIIPGEGERYLMASDGIRLSVDKKQFDRNFMLYAINSEYFRSQAINNSTGTTRLRIGLKTLRELKVAVPPLDEQMKISNILDKIQEKIKKEEDKYDYLNRLKKGLMQQLLTGKARVPIEEEEVTAT